MNKYARIIILSTLLFSNYVFAGAIEKRYELQNHGTLILSVPDTWIDSIVQSPENLPPAIHFSQKSGEQFEILFTPLWKTPLAQPEFGTPQNIKKLVEDAISNVSPQAVESNIKIKELGGVNIGFYFSATDKAPKPGEYKYMSQGAVGLGNIMCTFTILTNNPDSNIVKLAIKMFGTMKYSS